MNNGEEGMKQDCYNVQYRFMHTTNRENGLRDGAHGLGWVAPDTSLQPRVDLVLRLQT